MNKIVLVAPLAGAALLAGCGSTSHATRGTVPPLQTGTSSGAATSAAPTGTSTDTEPPPASDACTTANLSLSLGPPNGAAGSSYYPLHFTNTGSAACTITGYPGVSFVAPGGGQQVGAAATRSGDATPTATLAPGAEATATVQVASYQNFDPGTCAPTAVSGLRVYPPGSTTAAYVAFPGGNQQACSKDLSSTGSSELIIRPVKAGASGI